MEVLEDKISMLDYYSGIITLFITGHIYLRDAEVGVYNVQGSARRHELRRFIIYHIILPRLLMPIF